jgi:hypothetical protein
VKHYEPPPPPDDPTDFDAVEAWLAENHRRFEAWNAEIDRELKRQERVMSFLRIVVPLTWFGLALMWAARRQWYLATLNAALGVGVIVGRVWVDRRAERRKAEGMRRLNEVWKEHGLR